MSDQPIMKDNPPDRPPKKRKLSIDEIQQVFNSYQQQVSTNQQLNELWNALLGDLQMLAESKRMKDNPPDRPPK